MSWNDGDDNDGDDNDGVATRDSIHGRSRSVDRIGREKQRKKRGREDSFPTGTGRKTLLCRNLGRGAHYTRFKWHAAETVYSVWKKQSGDGVNPIRGAREINLQPNIRSLHRLLHFD